MFQPKTPSCHMCSAPPRESSIYCSERCIKAHASQVTIFFMSQQGCITVYSSLQLDVLPHPLFFKNFIFLPKQPYYYGDEYIASPLPFFHVIFFPTAVIFPSPLYKLILLRNRFYTPLCERKGGKHITTSDSLVLEEELGWDRI